MKLISAAAAIGAALLLVSCSSEKLPAADISSTASAIAEATPVYRFGVGYSGTGYTDALEQWRELVLQRTDGDVELQLFGDNMLGEGPDMARAVQRGTLSIVASSTSVCTDLVPQAAVMDLPACYSQYIRPFQVYTGEFYQALNECYHAQGLELLFLRTGEGWIISSSQPLTSLSQLNGMRVRTSGSTFHNKLYDTLGIERLENVGLNGLSYILQEGRVDGIEATCTILDTQNLLSAQSYGLGSLFVMSSAVTMNQQAFDSLPAEYQQILKASLHEVLADEQTRLQKSGAQEHITLTTLSDEDKTRLQIMAQPLMDEIRSIAGDDLLAALERENTANENL